MAKLLLTTDRLKVPVTQTGRTYLTKRSSSVTDLSIYTCSGYLRTTVVSRNNSNKPAKTIRLQPSRFLSLFEVVMALSSPNRIATSSL